MTFSLILEIGYSCDFLNVLGLGALKTEHIPDIALATGHALLACLYVVVLPDCLGFETCVFKTFGMNIETCDIALLACMMKKQFFFRIGDF